MSYDIWNTCLGVPDVTAAYCSGWVQAWGSLIGLGIAIGVPLWLRHKDREATRERELAVAHVVSITVLLASNPVLGALSRVRTEAEGLAVGRIASMNYRKTHAMLAALQIPSEEQLLRLGTVVPKGAILLAGGVNLVRQALMTLEIAGNDVDRSPSQVRKDGELLQRLCVDAHQYFTDAVAHLEPFLNELQARALKSSAETRPTSQTSAG